MLYVFEKQLIDTKKYNARLASGGNDTTDCEGVIFKETKAINLKVSHILQKFEHFSHEHDGHNIISWCVSPKICKANIPDDIFTAQVLARLIQKFANIAKALTDSILSCGKSWSHY